jgi:hypothetical protein
LSIINIAPAFLTFSSKREEEKRGKMCNAVNDIIRCYLGERGRGAGELVSGGGKANPGRKDSVRWVVEVYPGYEVR